MTPKQRTAKARQYRLLAGKLYVEYHNKTIPQDVRDLVKTAHDAMSCTSAGLSNLH